jgi:asparagine synthase (glutamine-hydrolysing)
MCAIAGKFLLNEGQRVVASDIQAMLPSMRYRGPDGDGTFVDGPVGLGHLRLSIIDLSAGAQPLGNEDGSVQIVFNGEIYNYLDLRRELESAGHVFKTHSDTEVIVHLYEQYGVECLQRLRGMFAFAIWDNPRQQLFVARDRVGIKPLYYHRSGSTLLFASEIKAILSDPSVSRDIDFEAIREFLTFYYLPGERTLFKSVRRLLPGHYFIANRTGVVIHKYWDLRFSESRRNLSFAEASEELYGLTRSTVVDHMMADVPVGVLLSGGMDSSAICTLAAEQSARKLHTFTIGFDDRSVVDERYYASLLAKQLGTTHYELSFSAEDFLKFLPEYVWHMEDPVCEPPAVALYYISKLASKHVKVLLSGEGGDEAFGGYPNYPNMMRVRRLQGQLGPCAGAVGSAAARVGAIINKPGWTNYGHALGHQLVDHYFSRTASPLTYFNAAAEDIFTADFIAKTARVSPSETIAQLLSNVKKEPLLNQLLYIDTKTWLPDDLLIKADKITMANSVELRVPLLDHVVLEFAASLPVDFKVRGKETKRILKSAFARALPAEVVNRKKAGFPVPYAKWLRTDLEGPVRERLIGSAFLGTILQAGSIERLLGLHQRHGNYAKEIFCLLTLDLWNERFCSVSARPQ